MSVHTTPVLKRFRGLLIASGILSFLLYLGLWDLSKNFNWGEGYAERPILGYLAIYFTLFALYALSCLLVLTRLKDRSSFWTLILFGLLFRAAVLPSQQIQEDDIYRYLWDGKVFAHGINPYEYAPSEVNNFKSLLIKEPEKFREVYSERNEKELLLLNDLKWENETSLKFLERVNHPDVPTIYPPMAQYVFRAVSHLFPDSILAIRGAFLLFDLVALGFIVLTLDALGKCRNLCLIYFWSPLIIKETFNSTHLDIIGISLLCVSVYFLVRNRHVRATLFLALSFLGKFYSGILLPVYLWKIACQDRQAGKSGWRGAAMHFLLFGGVVGGLYLPFIRTGWSTFEGLKTYTIYWQSNDSVFALLTFFFAEVLGLNSTGPVLLSYDLPSFLSKVCVALTLLVTLVYLLAQARGKDRDPEDWVRDLFVLMAVVFLLSPVQNPWYLCWVVPFLCAFPWRSWILLTGLVGLYYLDFYFDYQEIPRFSIWIPWVEYLPFYLFFTFEFWARRRREREIKPQADSAGTSS